MLVLILKMYPTPLICKQAGNSYLCSVFTCVVDGHERISGSWSQSRPTYKPGASSTTRNQSVPACHSLERETRAHPRVMTSSRGSEGRLLHFPAARPSRECFSRCYRSVRHPQLDPCLTCADHLCVMRRRESMARLVLGDQAGHEAVVLFTDYISR